MTAKYVLQGNEGVVVLIGAHMSYLQNIRLQHCAPSGSSLFVGRETQWGKAAIGRFRGRPGPRDICRCLWR